MASLMEDSIVVAMQTRFFPFGTDSAHTHYYKDQMIPRVKEYISGCERDGSIYIAALIFNSMEFNMQRAYYIRGKNQRRIKALEYTVVDLYFHVCIIMSKLRGDGRKKCIPKRDQTDLF